MSVLDSKIQRVCSIQSCQQTGIPLSVSLLLPESSDDPYDRPKRLAAEAVDVRRTRWRSPSNRTHKFETQPKQK